MEKCNCGKEAHYYWKKKATGEKLDLCQEHYEAMEKEVHQNEFENRRLTTTLGVISGRAYEFEKCPHGANCRYCKEFNLI